MFGIVLLVAMTGDVEIGIRPTPNAYTTDEFMARAQVLFSEERMNDYAVRPCVDPEYRQFVSDMGGATNLQDRAKVINYFIQQLHTIHLPDGSESEECIRWIGSRGGMINMLDPFFKGFEGDSDSFHRFCSYIGTVKKITVDWKLLTLKYNVTPELREKKRRESQRAKVGRAIYGYRHNAFNQVRNYIERVGDKLDDDEMCTFTNTIAKLTNPSESEYYNFIFLPARGLEPRRREKAAYPYPRLTGDRLFDSLADILRKKSLYPTVRRDVYRPFRADAFRILDERHKTHDSIASQCVPLVWWIRIMKEENGRHDEKCFDAEEQSAYISKRLLEWKKLGRYTDADIEEICKILEPELGIKIELKEF